MNTIDTVVIGAGHAGLAVSRLLTDVGLDHVVLDRGRVGERWRTERWDSLRLLTPNWMTRLPSWQHRGAEPDSFMSARGFIRYLERYAESFGPPSSAVPRCGSSATQPPGDIGRHRRRYLACPPRDHRDRPARCATRARPPGRNRGTHGQPLPQP